MRSTSACSICAVADTEPQLGRSHLPGSVVRHMPIYHTTSHTPIGPLLLAADDAGLRLIHFQAGPRPMAVPDHWVPASELAGGAAEQLEAYFAGELREFHLTLAPEGTPFQLAVWEALEEIPYGATVSYGGLAARIGRPGAARAVGGANARNPLPIVRPCHRVVGSRGQLTGFAGGLDIKRALLELEQRHGRVSPAHRPAP